MAKKRAKRADKQRARDGQVVRLSAEVLKLALREGKESYDKAFRRLLGIEQKNGVVGKNSYWVLTRPKPQIFPTKASALGASIVAMVKYGTRYKERPKKVDVVK
jgi:hypothetical protein